MFYLDEATYLCISSEQLYPLQSLQNQVDSLAYGVHFLVLLSERAMHILPLSVNHHNVQPLNNKIDQTFVVGIQMEQFKTCTFPHCIVLHCLEDMLTWPSFYAHWS